jgi:hypothetical protein
MSQNATPSRKANRNEKMVEITLRFWTNDIAANKGEIVPKHLWDAGMLALSRNKSHGIEPGKPTPFHSLMELPAAIEKEFIRQGIQLHHARVSRKYYAVANLDCPLPRAPRAAPSSNA